MKAFAFDPWIACHQPRSQARLRLFCFPYAGGGAPVFRCWGESLPKDVEVCPVQLPGRGSRLKEPPFTQLISLVKVLTQALHPLFDLPFAFFGHSLGGLISFELARELRRQHGIQPVRLLVSGSRAPQIPHRELPLHGLPEAEFLAELRRLNGTSNLVLEHEELMQVMLPLVRADFALYENYLYTTEPPLQCPISAFGGWDDPRVTYTDLSAWSNQTTSALSLKMFPGDHFFLNTASTAFFRALSEDLQ